MSNIISPTATLGHGLIEADYITKSAYQRLLLGQMGITPWVGQYQPVQAFLPEAIFETLLAETNASHSPTINEQIDGLPSEAENANDQSPALITAIESPLFKQGPVMNGATMPLSQTKTAESFTPQIITTPSQNVSISRCHCYAIKIRNWIIVADANVLEGYPQALQLWQNIGSALSVRQHEFRFPLVESMINLDITNTRLLVQASFAGFLCAVGRNTSLDSTELNSTELTPLTKTTYSSNPTMQKVGIVTPVAECLENDHLHRLPYLTEMLKDYRQKRQFWQLIIANER